MPVKQCELDNKPGFKWGDEGTCYTYDDQVSKNIARNKAIRQGQAIEISQLFVNNKVSFDYDDTLTREDIQEKALQLINSGYTVYIVTARNKSNSSGPYDMADKLGIPRSKVYFTNGEDKWKTIKRLKIGKHYDNNQEQVDKINNNTNSRGIKI